MNRNNAKFLNVLPYTFLVGLLASGIGAGSAFADGGSVQLNNGNTVTISSNGSTTSAGTTTVTGSVYGSVYGTGNTSSADPKILPGSVLYFVKSMYEKIELALTFNDVKKAELLAQFAQERIAEANALIAAGKPDLAKQVLTDAVQSQENALQQTNNQSSTNGTNSTNATNVTNTTNVTNATDSTNGTLAGNVNSSVVQLPTSGSDQGEKAEANVQIQRNILALANALQHVNNPQAQAELMKNIQKAFAHLEKKLDNADKKSSNEDDNNKNNSNGQPNITVQASTTAQADSSNTSITNVSSQPAVQEAPAAETASADNQASVVALPAVSVSNAVNSAVSSSSNRDDQENDDEDVKDGGKANASAQSEHSNKENQNHGEDHGNDKGKGKH